MSNRVRVLCLAGLACAFLLPATAQASNFSFGYWPGYYYGHGNNHHRSYGYGYGNSYKRGHGNNYSRGFGYGGGGYNNNYRPACHQVQKYSYDNYGNRVVIGGTQCYDDYGNAYIVPGSRRVIGY